ncbi:hypothetical protein Syun_022419 [Stephania yunnanensis]|uniref:Nucleoside diphosphate kinase-like domain-containing protein n=1 Tax=Stephania yunnanensis TaxID=152371 RepID=A0AAP0HYI5_9MAGN
MSSMCLMNYLKVLCLDVVPPVHTSIRALCGTDITLNCVHGSDSHKSASREIGFFFGTMFSTAADAKSKELHSNLRSLDVEHVQVLSHSCIHDQLLEQMRRPGRKEYSISPQVYVVTDQSRPLHRKGRALLGLSKTLKQEQRHPIRIYLNYDVVGHSPDRDCQSVGDIVKVSVVSNHCDLATFGY